jgi:hypothetical protein
MLSSFVNRALRGSGVRIRSSFQKTTTQQPLFSTNDANTLNLRGTGENNCCMTHAAST